MSDEFLGRDLRLEPGLYGLGLDVEDGDLTIAAGVDNLVQALLIRLNTPVGELADLAHPDYGSRLHELIGRSNNQTTRNLVRMFTLQALRQEPRVGEVRYLAVETVAGRPDLVRVTITLTPIRSTTPFNLVFSMSLEGTL